MKVTGEQFKKVFEHTRILLILSIFVAFWAAKYESKDLGLSTGDTVTEFICFYIVSVFFGFLSMLITPLKGLITKFFDISTNKWACVAIAIAYYIFTNFILMSIFEWNYDVEMDYTDKTQFVLWILTIPISWITIRESLILYRLLRKY
ncbi:hypothetical protein [Enterobacter kobei]|uniref:hypothetical protein n=1 Tax=Enterobacter kobei TaxID=208224 RepID=UPI0018A6344E|nr:hypothetical protein [Enterobacter kobei]BBV85991.1 hypothetical protein STW0522ENT62_14370 [Enterobacter kobei]